MTPPAPSSRLVRWLGPLLVAAAGAGMLAWSWGTWPDVLIDFGRELYVPWRLAEGEALYRDIAHFNGPLSPYLNAALFRLFGVGLRTLVVGNLVVLGLLAVVLGRLLAAACGAFGAAVGTGLFLLLFAFGQYVPCGNYNFVCPYSHGVTHGLTLGVAGVGCLGAYWRWRRWAWVAACGLCVGLALLTKAEVAAPAGLATVVGLGLMLRGARLGRRRALGLLAGYGAALVAPLLGAFGLLWTAMPAGEALFGTAGTWPYLLRVVRSEGPSAARFYGWQTGLLRPAESVRALLGWTGLYAAVLVPAAAGALALGRVRRARAGLEAAALLGLVLALGQVPLRAWTQALRPLPLLCAGMVAWAAVAWVRSRRGPEAGPAALRAALAVLATALLAKMPLHARLSHYGFALAMPGTVLLAAAFTGPAAAWLARRGGHGAFFRLAVLVCLGFVAGAHLRIAQALWRQKTHRVGAGPDAFLADGRGAVVAAALEAIRTETRPAETLAAFPEGVMLNYLARRRNPTPYLNFMPTELARYGAPRVLAAYQACPPDWVALVHKDTSEFGVRFFGQDYARELGAWIRGNYRRAALLGAEPLRDRRFGIALLRRAPP